MNVGTPVDYIKQEEIHLNIFSKVSTYAYVFVSILK